jgi:hypothetical protein
VDNIQINFKNRGWVDVDSINLTFVNTVMEILISYKAVNFLSS